MSTDLQATSSGAHPVPNSAHDDVFNSLMPSFRKNPLPATIIGFDYSGEVETDELFWHVAAKKGFTPDDFGQKTLADFGGPGVTPHVQKKRWDVWVANRNKNIKSVLQARHAVVKHKNYFGYNALLSNARTPRSPQAPGKTLEHTKQVMTQRIEFAQTHNQYLMRLEQEREQRKKNEIDRLNRHYDDINTENFLRYQDKMQQQVRLQQALVDRHRHEEEEAVLRENLRKQLEKENVKKTTLLELKHAHATAVCSARQEELRQKVADRSATKAAEISLRREKLEAEHLAKVTAKLASYDQSHGAAIKQKETQQQVMRELGQKRLEKQMEACQRAETLRAERVQHIQEKDRELMQKREQNVTNQRTYRDGLKQVKQQNVRERMHRVLATGGALEEQKKERVLKKRSEMQQASERQKQLNNELLEMRQEGMRLENQRKAEAVARAHIVKEIEFAAKKDVINGKYLQMLQNEQQRQNIAQEFENKRIAHMKKMMTMPKAHAACPPLQPRNSQSARSYGSMKGSQTSSHEQIAQETAVEGPEGFSERQYVDDSPDVGESVGHLDARRSCTEEADRGDAEDVEAAMEQSLQDEETVQDDDDPTDEGQPTDEES